MDKLQVTLTFMTTILLLGVAGESPIRIEAGGHKDVATSDVGIEFYIQVANRGEKTEIITFTLDKCCLFLGQIVPDCQILSSGLLGSGVTKAIHPDAKVNFTLIWPTLYPYDRAGQCEVRLTSRDHYQVHYMLTFNTALDSITWIPSFFQALVTGVSNCGSPDEDRLHHCHPVNCVLKYHGKRNHFNKTIRRCQPVPECMPDAGSQMPNKAFDARINGCKDLDAPLTAEDRAQVKAPRKRKDIYTPYYAHRAKYLVCVHGYETRDRYGCVCDFGWTSLPASESGFEMKEDTYYMCNVRSLDYINQMYPQASFVTLIFFACVDFVMVASLIIFVILENRTAKELTRKPSGSGSQMQIGLTRKSSSVYDFARVHTPNMSLEEQELDLHIGDLITGLEKTQVAGVWKGICNGVQGTFPVSCAEFHIPEGNEDKK